jgi:transcriptional pleiotropic regulator of transition state genes
MAIVKVTSKGQITIPIKAREHLGIHEGSYLDMEMDGDSLRFRKLRKVRLLSQEDPIWKLIGRGSSQKTDISGRHDDYLAEGEIDSWRSSP